MIIHVHAFESYKNGVHTGSRSWWYHDPSAPDKTDYARKNYSDAIMSAPADEAHYCFSVVCPAGFDDEDIERWIDCNLAELCSIAAAQYVGPVIRTYLREKVNS